MSEWIKAEDLKYTKSHEWIKVEGNTGTIGITSYATTQVKDIVFIELPKVGLEVKMGLPFGTLESVKAVFELLLPVSGKVIEINEKINSQPETVSKSPDKEGWLIKIHISDMKELNKLMNANEYKKYIEEEVKEQH
ncbi:MAG: glycine cleavage system protein GcvH [Candidatus Firestonebacteria bacterium]